MLPASTSMQTLTGRRAAMREMFNCISDTDRRKRGSGSAGAHEPLLEPIPHKRGILPLL
jgi:hypothetical protein